MDFFGGCAYCIGDGACKVSVWADHSIKYEFHSESGDKMNIPVEMMAAIDEVILTFKIGGKPPTPSRIMFDKIVYTWPNGSEIVVDVNFRAIVTR